MTTDSVGAALWEELDRVRWHLDCLADRRLLHRLSRRAPQVWRSRRLGERIARCPWPGAWALRGGHW